MQRPLYMRPLDAIEYGVIDRLVPPQKEMEIIDQVRHLQGLPEMCIGWNLNS